LAFSRRTRCVRSLTGVFQARVRAALHEAVVRAGVSPAAAEYPMTPGPILGMPKDTMLVNMHAKILLPEAAASDPVAAFYGQPSQSFG